MNLRRNILEVYKKGVLNYLNKLNKFIILFSCTIILMSILLPEAFIQSATKEENDEIIKDIKFEILANPEIGCNGLFKLEIRLINESQNALTFESEWNLPFHRVKIVIEDAITKELLNFFTIDRRSYANNYITIFPYEFIGRIFQFKIENGTMTLLHQRSIENLESWIGEEGYSYDIEDKDFVIKAFYRIRVRLEKEKGENSNLENEYIYKDAGTLKSNEIRVKNKCKENK
jgi:hypothetical protein